MTLQQLRELVGLNSTPWPILKNDKYFIRVQWDFVLTWSFRYDVRNANWYDWSSYSLSKKYKPTLNI